MRPIQFRMGSAGPGVGIGCGGIVLGICTILISPVGWGLVKGIGWIFILFGVFIVITGIYYWLKGPRKGRYL